jgi:hypothetical protein
VLSRSRCATGAGRGPSRSVMTVVSTRIVIRPLQAAADHRSRWSLRSITTTQCRVRVDRVPGAADGGPCRLRSRGKHDL